MKKLIVLTLSMLLLLSACGTSGQSEDKLSSGNKNAASEETITKEGSFAGLADSHTIAVNIDGKETTLQIDEDLQEIVNSIEKSRSPIYKSREWRLGAEKHRNQIKS